MATRTSPVLVLLELRWVVDLELGLCDLALVPIYLYFIA
jgi:hypothetical protein